LWEEIGLLIGAAIAPVLLTHKRDSKIRTQPQRLLALILVASLFVYSLKPAQSIVVTEYGLPGAPIPWGITVDSGGSIWITEQGANKIAKVTAPTYEYSIPTPGSVPWAITTSKDYENIWFTEETAGKIGMFVPSATRFYEWYLPNPAEMPRPRGITMNITKISANNYKTPQYDLWFTEYGRNRIGHLYAEDPKYANFSFYPIPTVGTGVTNVQPLSIAMSPIDYSIWFTEYATSRISSIKLLENGTALFRHFRTTPSGVDAGLWGIGVDPEGYVWVTESKRGCVGRLNPTSGEYVTFTIPTANPEPHELVIEVTTTTTPLKALNVWFTEYNADKVARYDPGLSVFFEYPIISAGGRPHGIAIAGSFASVWFTEPFAQRIGTINYWWSPPVVTTTIVGTITSATTTSQTLTGARTVAISSTTRATATIQTTGYVTASVTQVSSTQTYTSSRLQVTSTSIYSYSVTSVSTSYTTATSTTTTTQTMASVSSLLTTASTTATFTSWNVQTVSVTSSSTYTIVITSASTTTTTLTATSTSIYSTATSTLTNASYITTTTFSPTVTMTSVRTSVVPTTSSVASTLATTTTVVTTLAITRPCIVASAAYGSELAPEVQFLREFRDRTVMSTFAGAQFMRVFNAFYYSFSPDVARLIGGESFLTAITRNLIFPLLVCLKAATSALILLHVSSEIGVLVMGVLASCLTGTIYFLPLLVVIRTLRNRLRNAGGT
jgi:streptogramin lyase